MFELIVFLMLGSAIHAPGSGTQCDFHAPARLSGAGQMLEDESPYTGACGGTLRDYSGSGIATYTDGTQTDGSSWTVTIGKN